jgi:hypothetical protein
MRMMPMNTEKNTQPVQNLVLSPLKRFATIAADITIVVENSTLAMSNPSILPEGEKYA